MGRLLAVLAVAGLVLGLAACSGGGSDETFELIPEKNRKAAPVFTVKALNGDGAISLDDFRGKPVVLNFWASWCLPCKEETPELVAFAKAHPGIQVVGIAIDDEAKDSRAFAEEYRVTYPLGSDSEGDTQNIIGFPGLPATYFLDAQGRFALSEALGPRDLTERLDVFAALESK
jgi:cytochrome c biogenesis protein CcmG/thiol:disulfide interchange protein DsbE